MDDRKSYFITVRLDENTYGKLMGLMGEMEKKNTHMTRSELVRRMICGYDAERIGVDREGLKGCLRDIAGMGNNLNQIAHHMNSGLFSESDIKSLHEYRKSVSDIQNILLKIMKGLY